LEDLERAHVVEILARERGNKARAARALGVNRRSLYRIIEKYQITEEELTRQAGP
jgi:DNA-binding NtrC family response regulator